MKLTIDKLRILLKKYPEDLHCTFLYDIVLENKKFRADEEISIHELRILVNAGFKEIEVVYTISLYEYLTIEFPTEYRSPYKWANFIEIDKFLEELERVNTLSKRKRYIHVIGDIYGIDSKTARRITVLTHNEAIDYKKWNSVKRYIEKGQHFYYRNSENGIILFVNFKDEQTPYLEKFKKNTDLIAAMVSRRKEKAIEISPDFIPTEDVVSVTDPDVLLNEYIKTQAKLIIIGENINDSYRQALLKVKQYDRFVRMMVVPSLDPGQVDHFLLQVKMFYSKDIWSEKI